jgi:hypothetical protein
MKSSKLTFPGLAIRAAGALLIFATAGLVPTSAQGPAGTDASAQLQPAAAHYHGGSEVSFKMKLDDPLPEGAHFDVRLSPTAVDQEVTVSSGDPTDKERTEFLLKAKLPDKVVPGEWHIKVVWLFLPGASWTFNTLTTNADFKFEVEGPNVEIPTKATAALVGSDH